MQGWIRQESGPFGLAILPGLVGNGICTGTTEFILSIVEYSTRRALIRFGLSMRLRVTRTVSGSLGLVPDIRAELAGVGIHFESITEPEDGVKLTDGVE